MIEYKIDVIEALKDAGYPVQRIRNEKLLSQSTLSSLLKNAYISMDALNTICILIHCQPGDVIQMNLSEEEKEQFAK